MKSVMVFNFSTMQFEQATEAEGKEWLSLIEANNAECAAQQSMHADAACACPDDGNLQINSDFVCAVCHKTPRR